MSIQNWLGFAAASALFISGCDKAPVVQNEPPNEPPAPDVLQRPNANEKTRITLDAGGKVLLVEGVGDLGVWEPGTQQADSAPASLGSLVGTINVYAHDGTMADLETSPGVESHSHAGGSHGNLNSHCHVWVQTGPNTYRLVHC